MADHDDTFTQAPKGGDFSKGVTNELTIVFPSAEHAQGFKSWLCSSGEQSYWMGAEMNGEPRVEFDYWKGNSRIPTRLIED